METALPIHPVSQGGPLLDWLLIGPFHSLPLDRPLASDSVVPGGIRRTGFLRDYLAELGGEAALSAADHSRLHAELALTYQTEDGRLRLAQAQRVGPAFERRSAVDFNHILDGRHILERDFDYAVGYAFCILQSERAQVVHAALGSDGSPRVFLNGRLVHQAWQDGRATRPWQDLFRLELHAGLNPLLIKLENDRGWWGFQLEIYEAPAYLHGALKALRGLSLAGLEVDGARVACTVNTIPDFQELHLALPVEVTLEAVRGEGAGPLSEPGSRLAHLSGQTGQSLAVTLPDGWQGALRVQARLLDPEGREITVERTAYAGAFEAALSAIHKRFDRCQSGLKPDTFGAIEAGVTAWMTRFLADVQNPTDPWVVRTLEGIRAWCDASEAGHDVLAETLGRSFPVFFDRDGFQGNYLATLPPGCSPHISLPLVINLHGSSAVVKKISFGDPNLDYFAGDPPLICISPIAPHPLTARQNWDTGFLNALLADVCARFPVDEDRIYLQGGSGGGKGAWEWAFSNPERFAALTILCGFEGYPFRAQRLAHLPVWLYNGEIDLASYPFQPELALTAIRRAGGDAGYTLYPGLGHSISEAIDKHAWKAWFLSRRRDTRPVPPDPLACLDLSGEGIGPIKRVMLPAIHAYRLAGAERQLPYPQDNPYRAAMKLFQAYRKPAGDTPERLADGACLLRWLDGPADGPKEALLEIPAAVEAPQSGLLEPVDLPAMPAARCLVYCADNWPAFERQRAQVYAVLSRLGLARSGEERARMLVIADRSGYRLWELFIGLADGSAADL